jgi:formylglycine-generating enzyme required for sulfatase activity/uncharacterized protein (DUF2141 family)
MKKESKRKLTNYGFVALCLCVMFLANTCANPFFPEKKIKDTEGFENDLPPGAYTITMQTDDNGTASAPAYAMPDDIVVITAKPNTGYAFKEWQVVSGGISLDNTNLAMFTMPENDITIKALFQVLPAGNYSITLESDGNGIAIASPGFAEPGNSITITATPKTGYEFKEWEVVSGSVALADTTNPVTNFSMSTANVIIKAHFHVELPPGAYRITMQTDGNGSASEPVGYAMPGNTVVITAKPNTGYVFKEWQVVSGGISLNNTNLASFTMPANNVTIKAVFQELPVGSYSITLESDGNGIAIANFGFAEPGNNIVITAIPKTGYAFKEWQIVSGSISLANTSPAAFTMSANNVTIKVIFIELPPDTPNLILLPVVINSAVYGYSQPSAETVTITNTGTGAANITEITLNDPSSFTLSGHTGITTIVSDNSANFTVQPAVGLSIGVYNAEITATYNGGKTAKAFISFEVTDKINPVVTWPTASTITYPAMLSTSSLTGGIGEGSFSWTNGSTTPIVNNSGYEVTFTPSDTANYNTIKHTVAITVNKANPVIIWPTGLTAVVRQNLSAISLSGKGSSSFSGIFSWPNPNSSVGTVGVGRLADMIFTPYDEANVNSVLGEVEITVVADITSARGIKMVWIPAGTFMMGSPDSEPNRVTVDNREFQHSVTLTKGYYMGVYQVTQAQYLDIIGGTNPNTGSDIGNNRPIVNVSWYRAIVFCNRLSMAEGLTPAYRINGSTNPTDWGAVPADRDANWDAVEIVAGSTGYRLPTEAQWEYAARGDYPNKATEVNTKPFGIGDGTKMLSGMANFHGRNPYDATRDPPGQYNDPTGTSLGRTTDVGSYAANNYGLYDMHGNVHEWCWDWYNANYYTTPEAGLDPTGHRRSISLGRRVNRGGRSRNEGQYLRSAYRNYNTPMYLYSYVGFRLVRPF